MGPRVCQHGFSDFMQENMFTSAPVYREKCDENKTTPIGR
jgi:hypothetical protein